MPNWNENIVRIEGPKKELDKFLAKALKDGKDFKMETFIPEPTEEEYKKLKKAEGAPKGPSWTQPSIRCPDWYGWRYENWGTKWDLDDVIIEVDDNKLELLYDTPWNPNGEFWKTISMDYPELRIRLAYMELGMFFCGVMYIENGECFDNYQSDPSHEDMLDFCKEHDFTGHINWLEEEIDELEDKANTSSDERSAMYLLNKESEESEVNLKAVDDKL